MLRIGAHVARRLRRFASLAERIAHDADEAGTHATLHARRCASAADVRSSRRSFAVCVYGCRRVRFGCRPLAACGGWLGSSSPGGRSRGSAGRRALLAGARGSARVRWGRDRSDPGDAARWVRRGGEGMGKRRVTRGLLRGPTASGSLGASRRRYGSGPGGRRESRVEPGPRGARACTAATTKKAAIGRFFQSVTAITSCGR